METVVIETQGLSKKYRIGTRERLTLFSTIRYKLQGNYPHKELWALKDINISVKRGEMVAIIGPNGAGKSTLLRILSGILSSTSGSYVTREEVSCIFELGLGFNPMFSALENVYIYGALHGRSRKQVDKVLPQIIEFSGIEKFMGAKIRELSTGMKARLAFATVIQMVKGIVMIDEVLSVGDAEFQQKCVGAIEKLLNEGNTVLFVSHGITNVKQYCTNALYLDGGEQIGFGNVSDMEQLYAARTEERIRQNSTLSK